MLLSVSLPHLSLSLSPPISLPPYHSLSLNSGDIMSPPNLDRLLVLPTGCGEQNLVRLATNWVVADYLVTTEQLSDFIAVKIKNNIQIGMIECFLYDNLCISMQRTHKLVQKNTSTMYVPVRV